MAVKFIAQTDTLEQFRLEFNDLSANQFGDIANLSGSISASNLVDAMNETISIATSTAGWTIADETSTTQIIGGGNTLTVLGTANQIQTTVSPIDTITFSFPNNVTIPNNLTITNNVTASGSTHTLGTIEISGNTIRSTDSTRINIMPNLFSKITSQNGTIKLFSGGKQLKSLVNLIDVVRCMKFMADNTNIKNQIFNLSNEQTDVKTIAQICKKINSKVKCKENIKRLIY